MAPSEEHDAQPGAGHRTKVVIVNPLGAALRHYQGELVSLLAVGTGDVVCLTTPEPSATGRSRAGWLLRYLTLLAIAAARVRHDPRARLIVLWPTLGYLDLVLLRAAAGHRAFLVIHDPVPLVRGWGYGGAARRLGPSLGAGVGVIVHSRAARQALRGIVAEELVSVLPHPILPPRTPSPRGAKGPTKPVVRVLGQYKPERDVDALRLLASRLRPTADLEIYGRGWPEIEGWSVHSVFVSELEMDSLISSSAAVLIPYKRFFQSGIAIRSLELGVPAVGPADSSLDDMYGAGSALLVRDPDDWSRAVSYAMDGGREEVADVGRAWRTSCEQAWSAWSDH